MNKTTIAILIVSILILNCFISASAIDLSEEKKEKTSSVKIMDDSSENKSYHLFYSYGPAWMNLFTKISFTEGDQEEIDELNSMFKRHRLPKKILPVYVEELDFEIKYNLPVPIFSRFTYYTMNTTDVEIDRLLELDYLEYLFEVAKNIQNYSVFKRNKRHTVKVENFTGFFQLVKPRFFRILTPKFFIPAKFIAVGVCENITITK